MYRISDFIKQYWVLHPRAIASEEDQNNIEINLGIKLPKEYQEFISTYGFVVFGFANNKGEKSGAAFSYTRVEADRAEVHTAEVAFFENSKNLIRGYEYLTTYDEDDPEHTPSFPSEYLPIGNSSGQDQILLKVAGDQIGSVWYWQYNDFAWGTEDNTWLGYIANNLYDFINNLKPYE